MERKIPLFFEISVDSAAFLISRLLALDSESNEEITIYINSPGGSTPDMFAIIDTMKMIKSPIRTVVMGQASSAAAVIASAGKTRLITKNSEVMIHEVWTVTGGSTSQIQDDLDHMKNHEQRIIAILAENTGRPREVIAEMMFKTNRFFSAQEALAFGLADQIIQDNEAQLLKLSETINVEGYKIDYKAEGLSSVQLLKEGKFFHPAYGDILITPATLNLFKKNFDERVRGIDVSIDYTHENDAGEKPAACWVKALEVKENEKKKELWAKVEFTPKGKTLVEQKEYKYASADISVDYLNDQGKHFAYVLNGGTLTNRPFIKGMNPIKLSEYKSNKKEINEMEKDQLIASLKDKGVDVKALEGETTALKNQVMELNAKIKELGALPTQKETEIANLKEEVKKANDKIVAQEKEAAFNDLLVAGKVVPANKEKILKQFAKAEDLNAFYIDHPVIVNLKPSGSNGDDHDETLTEAESALVNSGNYTKEEIINGRKTAKKTKPVKK